MIVVRRGNRDWRRRREVPEIREPVVLEVLDHFTQRHPAIMVRPPVLELDVLKIPKVFTEPFEDTQLITFRVDLQEAETRPHNHTLVFEIPITPLNLQHLLFLRSVRFKSITITTTQSQAPVEKGFVPWVVRNLAFFITKTKGIQDIRLGTFFECPEPVSENRDVIADRVETMNDAVEVVEQRVRATPDVKDHINTISDGRIKVVLPIRESITVVVKYHVVIV